MKSDKTLFVIPARGGSKRLPGKNIRPLAGKPLILYSVDTARQFVEDSDICITTDDVGIKGVVEEYGLKVPFIRPDYLATDTATSHDPLVHAVKFYQSQGIYYDGLLQPTSPLRRKEDLASMLDIYDSGDWQMVVSVIKPQKDILGTLCVENVVG